MHRKELRSSLSLPAPLPHWCLLGPIAIVMKPSESTWSCTELCWVLLKPVWTLVFPTVIIFQDITTVPGGSFPTDLASRMASLLPTHFSHYWLSFRLYIPLLLLPLWFLSARGTCQKCHFLKHALEIFPVLAIASLQGKRNFATLYLDFFNNFLSNILPPPGFFRDSSGIWPSKNPVPNAVPSDLYIQVRPWCY
jgi:hypothetical protein